MTEIEIIIIGAGASGLIAARELSKKGKTVTILEARERSGGRIMTMEKNQFGYFAEGGAEFIHGDLPVTKSLMEEAKLTLLPYEGQTYNVRKGELTENEFIPDWHQLIQKLEEVKEDIPIAQFLNQHFPQEKYSNMYQSVKGFVEGYDAADTERASTLALRDEWISETEATQYRIKEGYGALINFLEADCKKNGVKFLFNSEVKSIQLHQDFASIHCTDNSEYIAGKIILTVPLPVLKKINFNPPLPEKINAINQMGYGIVIKFLLQFKNRWWLKVHEKDLSQTGFIFSNELVPTWWTQYPETYPVLTGWLAGPNAEKFIDASSYELLDLGLKSLSNIFNLKKDFLKNELLNSKVINWGADPFALGAYAYATPETNRAKDELLKPVNNILFFSGEALYEGKEMGTVEAALASGIKTAEII